MIMLYTYSINFQKVQIPVTPQTSIFPGNNNQCVGQCEKSFLKKNISFSGLRSRYNRVANRKKLIFPWEKYFKTLKVMTIGTESFTIFQSGLNNGVKLWAFDEYPGAFPDKVNPDMILQMKQ